MHSEAQFLIALSNVPELGPARIKKLLEHFGTAEKIWSSDIKEISSLEGIGERIASNIQRHRSKGLSGIHDDYDDGTSIISFSCPGYPKRLSNIYDPPPVIYTKGGLLPEDDLAIAVVGTRQPTLYGKEMTKVIVKGLVDAGCTIVSGLAIGIDSAAHEAAIEAGGRTIAVLGTGLKKIYPGCNRKLAEKIKENGALISEYYEVRDIEKWTFPKRNRLISGLSMGTLVIEGTSDSGSLITAGFALDQDREVFAVPGQIGRELSRAPNMLIKQGAKLVESVEDILDELNIKHQAKKNGRIKDLSLFSIKERHVLSLGLQGPRHIDFISNATGVPVEELSLIITELKLKGALRELPGKYFLTN